MLHLKNSQVTVCEAIIIWNASVLTFWLTYFYRIFYKFRKNTEDEHYGRYKEKFDEKELPEHKKCIGSTVFQVILNSGGGFAERICYLE